MKAYLSHLAGKPLVKYLEEHGCELHFMTGENTPVYSAVKTHADIHMCRLGIWNHVSIFMGRPEKLAVRYPGNIIYNAVCTSRYFIHNMKHTDPDLLDAAKRWHSALHGAKPDADAELVFVNVAQGYARCCCLPVDDTSFITSDEGIAKALAAAGADLLFIEKGHILLPGFHYGFIGGCCGHIVLSDSSGGRADGTGRRTILFNGNLPAHPDFERITEYIHARDIDTAYFEDHPLTDIGSIFTL